MARILVSNDDGIDAPGIQALAAALKAVGEVTVVAPEREQSAASHALTLHKPLRIYEGRPGQYAISGTPTDCVNMAVHQIMAEPPDLLVSGINRGANLGDDVTYSGTVSAAMEGTLLGIPSIAISQLFWQDSDYQTSAAFAATLAQTVLDNIAAGNPLPVDTLLNVNVPDLPQRLIRGTRWTTQGKRRFTKDQVIEQVDPRGRKYYWVGGSAVLWEGDPKSDHAAVTAGYISVMPVHLDLTHYGALEALSQWQIPFSSDGEPDPERS